MEEKQLWLGFMALRWVLVQISEEAFEFQQRQSLSQSPVLLLTTSFCGLYSLRPSHGRMSMRNVADPLEGQEAVRSTPGPMAHSPEDIELVMKTYLLSEPWLSDPAVLRLPWVPFAQPNQQYCFAVAYGDELVSHSLASAC